MIRLFKRPFATALACLLTLAASSLHARTQDRGGARPVGGVNVPVTYYKLPNGLKVVLSQDRTAPTVAVAVYYKIGFRIEPRDRTGFAHLFEHMMFQGSRNLPKGAFDRLTVGNGGINNGSTRFDFTNYFEIMPAHTLRTVLWAEADRMRGLSITNEELTNQKEVVKNEVRVNVLNQPYGGFPWLNMPQYANTNWHNAHNFYGDLKDLEAATLGDVEKFFDTYYAPNNAVLVVVGDFEEREARQMIDKYFASIPASKQPVTFPDISDPRQEKEKRDTKQDPLAPRPALAFSYHMPPRGTPEYYAVGLLDQLLVQGEDSLLWQELVKQRAYTGGVQGGANVLLGNIYNYQGPMLWTVFLFRDRATSADQILAADSVIKGVQDAPVPQATVDRALVKVRSQLYNILGQLNGFGRADLLASFALFDDDPSRINEIEANYRKVTPEVLQRTAREYLRTTNRTVLVIEPKDAAKPTAPSSPSK